jgi:hypothetical protein
VRDAIAEIPKLKQHFHKLYIIVLKGMIIDSLLAFLSIACIKTTEQFKLPVKAP